MLLPGRPTIPTNYFKYVETSELTGKHHSSTFRRPGERPGHPGMCSGDPPRFYVAELRQESRFQTPCIPRPQGNPSSFETHFPAIDTGFVSAFKRSTRVSFMQMRQRARIILDSRRRRKYPVPTTNQAFIFFLPQVVHLTLVR